jgi:hypothetical protein
MFRRHPGAVDLDQGRESLAERPDAVELAVGPDGADDRVALDDQGDLCRVAGGERALPRGRPGREPAVVPFAALAHAPPVERQVAPGRQVQVEAVRPLEGVRRQPDDADRGGGPVGAIALELARLLGREVQFARRGPAREQVRARGCSGILRQSRRKLLTKRRRQQEAEGEPQCTIVPPVNHGVAFSSRDWKAPVLGRDLLDPGPRSQLEGFLTRSC